MTEQLEQPEDAGAGEASEVKRWLLELDLADKNEKTWREKAVEVFERYRNEKDRSGWRYNILWSNTEVLRPHLYGALPKADVRQRYRDKDRIGQVAAEILERGLDYSVDTTGFDNQMPLAILDYLLPGRAVCRVRFNPVIDTTETGERISYASVPVERVEWDRFRRGHSRSVSGIPWVAYEHHLTKSEMAKKFPDCAEKVNYDVTADGVDAKRADEDPEVFRRTRVWEIWDKEKREILFLAPSCKEQFLHREPDKLNLEGFFDCEILYSVESGTSLVPIPEYEMYRDQAAELDRITARISKIEKGLKLRGIYDSTISEFETLFGADDNDMIPTSSALAAMQSGGLDKAVWMMPLNEPVAVLRELYVAREQIKQTIYELTGVSDILRGATNPNETLGAQQLKAQTGSMRLQRRQRDVQNFVRNLIRKQAEIIAEHFPPELLSLMTGITLMTQEEKQQAQMSLKQAEQLQQAGAQIPPPPPEMLEKLSQPTWEEITGVLRSDILRSFRVDIETDSTIAADQASERQQVTDLISGIGSYVQQMTPAVQGGLVSKKVAKEILQTALRRFKLGRGIDDMLEEDEPEQPQPDPQAEIDKANLEIEATKAKAKAEYDAGRLNLDREKLNADVALKQNKMQMDAQNAQADREIKVGMKAADFMRANNGQVSY